MDRPLSANQALPELQQRYLLALNVIRVES